MYGLVFAGGGVRGAYQVGVWKALKELKINIGAAVGTSIGAINAALFAQGDFETACGLWRQITIEDIIALPEGGITGDNLFEPKTLMKLSKDVYKNAGFDMSPLKNLLSRVIDESKLRKSAVDFGCSAYSVTERSSVRVFREDIGEGKLIDYLMASASIMGIKEIDGERFTDGGVADNMPTDMLVDKGYTDIIEVDVRGIGVYKSVSAAGCNIINIRCSEPKTGIMDFNADGIEKSIAEGYLDCMRAFGRLKGERYYIEEEKTDMLSADIMRGLEKAAAVYGVDRLRAYTVSELVMETLDEYEKSKDSAAKSGDEKKLIPWLVAALDGKKNDFIKNGLEIFGSNYSAASSILYFKRKLR